MTNCSDVGRCNTTVEYVGYIYIIPVICSLGVVFNLLVLLVFSRSNFQTRIGSSTLTYLTGLAVADGMASLISLPIGFLRCLDSTPGQEYFWNWYDKYVYFPMANTFVTASIWITLAVSLERCIFVSRNKVQVNYKEIFRTRTARVMLVIIYALSLAICIPVFFYYEDLSSENNTLVISSFGKSVGYEIYSWIRMFLVKLIPIVVVTACNAILIKTTRAKTRKISGIMILPPSLQIRRAQTQKRLTYMLLSISTVFIICNIAEPFAHTGVYKVLFGECSIYTEDYYMLSMFTNMFEFIAFASNFVSYCIFHKHFIETLRMVFTCKKNKVRPACSERRLTRQSQNPYIVSNEFGQEMCDGVEDRANLPSTSQSSASQRPGDGGGENQKKRKVSIQHLLPRS